MKRFVVALLLCSLLFPVGTGAAEVFTYTPVKHATLVLQSGPATIYVDPVGVAEDFAGFPPPDLILITHIHKDHLDPQLVASLKKARTQVIGYLVIENGAYVFGQSMAAQMPFLVELGILLDLLVGMFVMSIVIHQINREFDHIDVDQLNLLKG